MNDQSDNENVVIIDVAGLAYLRDKIASIQPLLKIDPSDIKRKWWHFGRWKPAMNNICRRNNEIFEQNLPDEILLSVDIAFKLALYMTTIGHFVDHHNDNHNVLHEQLMRYEEQFRECSSALANVQSAKRLNDAALEEKRSDDAASLAITVLSAFIFTNPFTIFSAARQAINIATGEAYEPYIKESARLRKIIKNYEAVVEVLTERKEKAVDYIDKTNQQLAGLDEKKDPVLQNYGLVINKDGLFTLKRGRWFCLPWDVSFGEPKSGLQKIVQQKSTLQKKGLLKKDPVIKQNRTPQNMFEIAVLDVGIRPAISESRHFGAYPNHPPFNVAFLHRRTTQYLCGLKGERVMGDDIRDKEMKLFAERSLGRLGSTSTGRFFVTKTEAKKWDAQPT